jgi:alpha-ketoglutaric semialdehyde dehydrogenase
VNANAPATIAPRIEGTSFIGFQRGTGTQPAGHSLNPATGAVLEPAFISALPGEVDRACRLAGEAFRLYSKFPAPKRSGFLRAIAANIEALGDALTDRMSAETALPVARVQGERARTCMQLRMFADVIEEGSWLDARIDTADPARQPLPKPDMRSMLRPIGPVAVFCAGNFPLAYSVAGGDTASVLAAGCPVIVNAHSGHMGTAELVGGAVVSAAQATRMPEGVFSLVFGAGYEVGQMLVRHPAVRGVGFTGSRRGGRAIMDIAAARTRPIPVYAEMSSVNPVFILPNTLRENWGTIAAGLYGSVTGGVGQFCTKPGLVFLPAGREADQFLEKLSTLMLGTSCTPMLNAGIAENFSTRRSQLAAVPAVKLVAEGAGEQAALFETTAQAFLENGVLHEEIFGPSTLVVLCNGEPDMMKCAQALEGQLTATIHASKSDFDSFGHLSDVLRDKAGRLIWNGFPTGLEVTHATGHGGPYPATSDGRSTSVGSAAITRWARIVCFQNHPNELLPLELQDANPAGIPRKVNGVPQK